MKIEFITSYFLPFTGGIENVVLHLADGLSKQGHTVVIHTANTYPGAKERLPSSEKRGDILIKRYAMYPFSLFFPEIVFPDSVISLHNYSALMNDYVTRRYPKHKKIIEPYGTITYNRSQRKYPFFSIVYDILLGKKTIFAMDSIIAMTDFEKKCIIKKYPQLRKKVETIPGGIDIITPKKYTIQSLPGKFFFSVGRIAISKRFEDVLYVLPKFPSYHYVLAGGDSGYLSKLYLIAKEKGVADRFHYIGRVTDNEKAYLMRRSAIAIMPSSAEAFSIASVEAFYYGNTVVGANSGGIIDIFHELQGELYETGNTEELQIAIMKCLQKKVPEILKSKRRKIISRKYSWDKIVNQYEKILRK